MKRGRPKLYAIVPNQSVEVPLSARRGLRIKQAAEYLGNYYVIFKDDLDAYVDSLRSKAGVQ